MQVSNPSSLKASVVSQKSAPLLFCCITCIQKALVFCNRQGTVFELNSWMLCNDLGFRLFSCHITKERVLSLSTHCLPFSTALISNSKLTSLNDIALIPREFQRLTWSFIRLISSETTSTIQASHELGCKQAPSEVGKKIWQAKRVGVIASAHVSNQRHDENVAKNCSKVLQICRLITTSRRFKCVFLKWLIPLDVVA